MQKSISLQAPLFPSTLLATSFSELPICLRSWILLLVDADPFKNRAIIQ